MIMAQSSVPSSILIIGSGVFGLSTALSLATNPKFEHASITLVERWPFPAPDGGSIDTSRIIRADYASPAYAKLALAARPKWRGEWGSNGRYHEVGFVLTSEGGEDSRYVSEALQNVISVSQDIEDEQGLDEALRTKTRVLNSREDVEEVTRFGTIGGELGYVNFTSGWADAEMTMRYMRSKLEALRRINFATGAVTRLRFSDDRSRVRGATLADGQELEADLTVVAAGAWSSALVDLRGLVTATGQILAYIRLSREEQTYLSACPAHLNFSTAMFIIPPPPIEGGESSRHAYLKIARHGYGYCNPVRIPHPESIDSAERITVSLPHTNPSAQYAAQPIPDDALEACRSALRGFGSGDGSKLPSDAPSSIDSIRDRPFAFTRLCHYADTPSGDFLIAYHPNYSQTLFVATGGSGHGFKFAPVLGDAIVDCILGQPPEDFKEIWAWPAKQDIDRAWRESVEAGGGGWTGDGSKGGRKGMKLAEELSKSKLNQGQTVMTN